MRKKKRYTVSVSPEARERIAEWGDKNHICGGFSGAIESLAWSLDADTKTKRASIAKKQKEKSFTGAANKRRKCVMKTRKEVRNE